ncbi:MAG: peptide chain release factor N(5)-glutamine methyltransferase [Clostridia bacterium]|nr:peptide chain release factor N(5)-glutamine methyltransferase [Clostridia bacterium]
MTINEALKALKLILSDVDDGDIEARYILEKVSGVSYTQMLFKSDSNISDEAFEEAVLMAQRRFGGEPIQYILGSWDFMDFTFRVGEGVLIPRPETEILVEYILDKIKNIKEPVVYDLCSGSGCIGLSIACFRKDAKVYLVEKSEKALAYLTENQKSLCGDSDNIQVIKGDILITDDFSSLPEADVIVSNPPYIRSDEIPSLQSEVLREPVMALDGGEDGLIFYRVLVNEWSKKLSRDGFMAFECGEDQAEDISELFSKINFDSEIVFDYNNIQRIVIGRRKSNDS